MALPRGTGADPVILQNISKAIREQNYYAVVLEFVIVIAGVVIGFQINAWNELRQDEAERDAVIGLLLEDLAADIDTIEYGIINEGLKVAVLERILSQIDSRPLDRSFDEFLGDNIDPQSALPLPTDQGGISEGGQILRVGRLFIQRGAFDTITSTGVLGDWQNRELLSMINNYYARTADIKDSESRVREYRMEVLPRFHDVGLSWEPRELSVNEIAQALEGDRAAISALRSFWRFSAYHYANLSYLRMGAIALQAQLEAEVSP